MYKRRQKHIYTIKIKVSVIYGSSMFCNSLLRELMELQATTDDGNLFQRRMISGKNESWRMVRGIGGFVLSLVLLLELSRLLGWQLGH